VVLPTTVNLPPRNQLWAAAKAMIKAHPLLGVGPDGYRLSYGAYIRPPLRTWDTRVTANNLFLEMFADLGIVGGGLFLAFLAVVMWPVIVALWRGSVTALWQVALVGAVAVLMGHGLVDQVLAPHAMFFLFWILCGLAATAGAGSGSRLERA
jgi:O-antigen ligase